MQKRFVVVDGVTYSLDDEAGIEATRSVYSLPGEYDEQDGAIWEHYRAGVTTWTVTVAGKVVYQGTDVPTRTETEDSITYTIASALTPDDTQEVAVVPFRG